MLEKISGAAGTGLRILMGAAFTAAPLAAVLYTTVPSSAQSVDIEAIFNCAQDGLLGEQTPEQCAASRTVLLNNCTSCHTFVPIVKAQKSEDAWKSLLQVHRVRVQQVPDDQYAELERFLVAHFNETNPVPALPPELEALGTNLPE